MARPEWLASGNESDFSEGDEQSVARTDMESDWGKSTRGGCPARPSRSCRVRLPWRKTSLRDAGAGGGAGVRFDACAQPAHTGR